MKKTLLSLLAYMLIISSCNKENSSKSVTLSDDQIALQGEVFEFSTHGPSFCGAAIYGYYTHYRDVIRPNTTQNTPTVNITLTKLPDPGQTATFTLDNGTWLYSATSPAGRATMRVSNYYDASAQQQQNWFSDSLSGTVTVAVSSAGKPTFNFTDVKLIHTYTDMDKRKTVSGKNVVCH
ncbi:MAG: hypothetical protein KF872_10290 [Chitinophagales bacterium]|nr:hypothetical protein [Chitinophagales bacterium]